MSAFVSKKYSWRNGYSYKVKADIVGGVLEEIEKRDGSVTSESFLEESRAEESPTHSMFEWDDSIAAEKYRLRQATAIINQIEVSIVNEGVERATAYVNVKQKGATKTAQFVNVQSAMSDDEMRMMVLKNALGELRAFERKYSGYVELAGVFSSIESFEKEVS